MATQDTSDLKEKILFILKRRGPSLPVHIATEVGLSILFSSAFLSELLSEKKIKISHMKVGNSPLYFISGQEFLLERFSQHLKSKEKDAFGLLKEKKFLVDSKQDPAIRVALRAIKDFAKPFKKDEEIIWRYFRIPESEFKLTKKVEEPRIIIRKSLEQGRELEGGQKELNIFDKKPIKKATVKKTIRRTVSQKKNEKFFNRVKEFLAKKSIEISGIEGFSKSDLILKIIDNKIEKLLIAYNKKRITEADLLKAYKKASELNLPYVILSLGELPKKLNNFIEAVRKLSGINKIE